MKKYLLYYMIVFSLSSCNEMFSPIDENIPGNEYVNSDPASAEGLLLNAYVTLNNQFSWNSQNSVLNLSVSTDDAVSNLSTHPYRKMISGELTSGFNPLGTERWNNNYKAIFYINRFLSVVDNVKWMDDPEVNELMIRRLKGEALALRAFHHYLLLECFAGKGVSGNMLGVKYFSEFVEPDENFDLQRIPLSEMVDKIMQDYEEAYKLLPYIYSDNPADIPEKDKEYNQDKYLSVNSTDFRQRMCGEIVKALEARLMLFVGSSAYLDDKDLLKKAAEYSVEVLSKKSFILSNDGLEFYNDDNDENNGDILWRQSKGNPYAEPEMNLFPPSLNGNGRINPSQNFVDAFPMKDGYPVGESDLYNYNPQDPYKDRDPRLSKFVIYNGASFGGSTINTTGGDMLNGVNKVFEKSTRTGYYLKKLLRPDVIIPVSGNPQTKLHFYPFIRYTELFLILAEAQNEIEGPDYKIEGSTVSPKDIMRKIRQRAMGLSSDPYLESLSTYAEMKELIRNERRIELSFEGFRFWDLKRWGIESNNIIYGYYDDASGAGYQEIEVDKQMWDGEKYKYMPIPRTDEIKYGIEQNFGW